MLALTGLGCHRTIVMGGTAALHNCEVWGAVTFPGGEMSSGLIQNPFGLR